MGEKFILQFFRETLELGIEFITVDNLPRPEITFRLYFLRRQEVVW